MRRSLILVLPLVFFPVALRGETSRAARVPLDDRGRVDACEVAARLNEAIDSDVARPAGKLLLRTRGAAGALTRAFLAKSLGADTPVEITNTALIVRVRDPRDAASLKLWRDRIAALATATASEIERRSLYGMRSRPSYRPNDPSRPTICLVHGMNSTSGVFKHMFKPLEEAGYGLVVYDFPYNRGLDDTCAEFVDDWRGFRRGAGERLGWVIVAHSLGALPARSYVEGSDYAPGEATSLMLIAPVNQGSALAGAQTLMQYLQTARALEGDGGASKAFDGAEGGGGTVARPSSTQALAKLGDGLGEAAGDIAPGSAFLTRLNARPRRSGVRYHILAGDAGFLSADGRRRIEERMALASGAGGLFGGVARAVAGDLAARLDDLTAGRGDGCVAVARTRLAGVDDFEVVHANHLELIRAPLLYPDPGPVASMPFLLKRLAIDAPVRPAPAASMPTPRPRD